MLEYFPSIIAALIVLAGSITSTLLTIRNMNKSTQRVDNLARQVENLSKQHPLLSLDILEAA